MKRHISGILLHTALAFALTFAVATQEAVATEDLAPATYGAEEEGRRSFSTGNAFFDDASVSGNLYYFQRKRTRYDIDRDRYANNLDHATLQAGGEFVSGFWKDLIGADIGAFVSYDLFSEASADHEMNFFPWRDPWHADWSKTHTQNGASIHKALIKAKAGPAWARAGYLQPVGPGVLGVNWSLFPGTYQGAEAGLKLGDVQVAGAWADRYKAPWYKDTFRFRRDDGSHVAWVWSLGARYTPSEGSLKGVSLEAAYGESERYLKNGHIKAGYEGEADGIPYGFGYTLYAMEDSDATGEANDIFHGRAYHHVLHARYQPGAWTLKVEFTYTQARQTKSSHLGYFAYRLATPNGGAKGAYDTWWDARSDWNHDEEKAIFAYIGRSFDDMGLRGVSAGVGYAHGWDGRALEYSERLNEKALTLDLAYTVPEGRFQGISFAAHYTEYRNSTSLPSWQGYRNAFQDERDFKFLVSVPFSL